MRPLLAHVYGLVHIWEPDGNSERVRLLAAGKTAKSVGDRGVVAQGPPATRSRLTNGTTLLPGIDGRSDEARHYKDTYRGMIGHLGGDDAVTLPQMLVARRIAAFETDLLHLEARHVAQRVEGVEPSVSEIDLRSRLANTQRRLIESVGLERVARDVTPALHRLIDPRAEDVGDE